MHTVELPAFSRTVIGSIMSHNVTNYTNKQ